MKRWIALFLVLAMAGAGWYWWKQEAVPKAPRYRMATLERGTVASKVSATGTLQAVKSIDVGSQVSGTITQVYVEHNALVKKG